MIRLARAVTKRRFGRKRIGGSAVRGNLGRRPLPRPTAGLNGVTGREQDQGSQKRLHAGLSLSVGLLPPEAAGKVDSCNRCAISGLVFGSSCKNLPNGELRTSLRVFMPRTNVWIVNLNYKTTRQAVTRSRAARFRVGWARCAR